jgi:cytochrome c-type biogenesis protein CcmE
MHPDPSQAPLDAHPADGPAPLEPAAAPSQTRFLVLALVSVLALVAVVWSSFDSEVYFLTVSEVESRAESLGESEFRLKGLVMPGSHQIHEEDLGRHRFVLVEQGAERTVYFSGALPDTFADEAEVVALGRLRPDGTFEATEVVAKCPSRYEQQAPTASASNP